MKKVSKLDEYLFDLNGYLIIKNALSNKELKEINKILDKLKNLNIFILPPMKISINNLPYSNCCNILKFNAVIRNYLWWALEDLNLGPLRYERSALTN